MLAAPNTIPRITPVITAFQVNSESVSPWVKGTYVCPGFNS